MNLIPYFKPSAYVPEDVIEADFLVLVFLDRNGEHVVNDFFTRAISSYAISNSDATTGSTGASRGVDK